MKKFLTFTRLVKPFARFRFAFEPKAQSGSKTSQTKFRFAHSYGFTLAEVLITLSILGVVAAITVPSLINRNTEKQTVTKVLKMYSTLSNAYDRMWVETNGNFASVASNTTELAQYFITNYLNVSKYCPTGGNECYLNDYPTSLTGTKHTGRIKGSPSARLKDGSTIAFSVGLHLNPGTCNDDLWGQYPDLGVCGTGSYEIHYDTNGPKKGPNVVGKDIFVFVQSKNGIIVYPDNPSCGSHCSLLVSDNIYAGYACTDYLIKNRNMNYLH